MIVINSGNSQVIISAYTIIGVICLLKAINDFYYSYRMLKRKEKKLFPDLYFSLFFIRLFHGERLSREKIQEFTTPNQVKYYGKVALRNGFLLLFIGVSCIIVGFNWLG